MSRETILLAYVDFKILLENNHEKKIEVPAKKTIINLTAIETDNPNFNNKDKIKEVKGGQTVLGSEKSNFRENVLSKK